MKIDLKPFEEKDIERLISWTDSQEFLLQWAGPTFTYPLTEVQIKKYLKESQHIEHGNLKYTSKIFKAIEGHTNRVVGHISLAYINEENKRATLGEVLIGNPEDRGKGYGTQMVQEALKVGFETLNLHCISLSTSDFNTPAIKCYENVGFIQEGKMRDVFKVGQKYWSYILMSMLETEWKK